MSTVWAGSTLGAKPPTSASAAGAGRERGQRHAVDVADTVVSGVFMSPWASTQMRPSGRPSRRAKLAEAATTGAEAVIAAEHDRWAALEQHVARLIVERLADARDLAEIPLPRIARRRRLLGWRVDVAVVVDLVAECGQALADAGDPHRGGAHVDAAAAAAEVERNADDDAVPAHDRERRL